MLKKECHRYQSMMYCVGMLLFIQSVFMNELSAQKMRVINRLEDPKHIALEYVELDTLNMQFYLSYLEPNDLYRYSIVFRQDLPFDVLIPFHQWSDEFKYQNQNMYILYQIPQQTHYSTFYQSNHMQTLLLQGAAVNPFVDEMGHTNYHVFLLEINNQRNNKIVFYPNTIVCYNEQYEQKNSLVEADLLSDITLKDELPQYQQRRYSEHLHQSYAKSIQFKKKIITDNLFSSETIYSQGRVTGLICFPIKDRYEKITKIIIPKIKYVFSKQDVRQVTVEFVQ